MTNMKHISEGNKMNQREIHQSTLNTVKSINKSGTIVLYPSACKYHDDFQTLEFDNVILCSIHFEQSTITDLDVRRKV